ncbi:MAG: hypothetical protein GYA21_10935 [Myxococcales bacterium]|nr:hypothetical protein [Myxococcales bacterium]
MGSSLFETHQVQAAATCRCGRRFEVSVIETIDLGRDLRLLQDVKERERLRRAACPACGAAVEIEHPLYLHDPAARRLWCVFPERLRPREIELRIAFLQRLLSEGAVGSTEYARQARFVFGWGSLPAEMLAAPDAASAEPAAIRPAEGVPRAAELSEKDFEEVVDAEEVARRDAAVVARWKESGQSHYMFLDQGALHLFQRMRRPADLGERADLLFQLHRTENFPLIVLLLVAEGSSGARQVLTWPFNLDNHVDVGFLESLARHFEVRLHLFDEHYRRQRTLVLAPPLERNVAYVLSEARRWLERIEPRRRNFFLAVSKLDEGAYRRLGERPVGLQPEAFRELPSPSVTRLSLQILTHWSQRQNYEYLIFVKSFPVATFQAILREVLDRAIFFGLAMSEKMQRLSVELGLVPDQTVLRRTLLENFERVVTGERVCDLDLESQLENWRALLDDAERAGFIVEGRFRERLLQTERQRQESENLIPLELVGGVEMLDDLRELPAEDLTALLAEPEHRLEALRALCESGSGKELEEIERAVLKLRPAEADALEDALGRLGPAARPMLERLSAQAVAAVARAGLRGLTRLLGPAAAAVLLREVGAGRRTVWKVAADLLAALPEVDAEALSALGALARDEGRKRLLQTAERCQCPALREWAGRERCGRGKKCS